MHHTSGEEALATSRGAKKEKLNSLKEKNNKPYTCAILLPAYVDEKGGESKLQKIV